MYKAKISSKVTSLGLPPVHTSDKASLANLGKSSSFIFNSLKLAGILTSLESFLTASTASLAASYLFSPSTFSPIATAISTYLSMQTGILNSITIGKRTAFATPCGISNIAPSGCAIE